MFVTQLRVTNIARAQISLREIDEVRHRKLLAKRSKSATIMAGK